jgi:hypothetical protein
MSTRGIGIRVGRLSRRAGRGDVSDATPLASGRSYIEPLTAGSWSRYSLGGPESTLEYHTLLRDILGSLCHRQGSPVYCDTEARFTQYLAARPG